MNEIYCTCRSYPDPSTDPREYVCPTCRAGMGAACKSPQRAKVENSHIGRHDVMVRRHHRWYRTGDRVCQMHGNIFADWYE